MNKQEISGLKQRDDLIDDLISNYKSKCAEKITIITGPSGSGKSYIVCKLLSECNNKDLKNKICAFTNLENILMQTNKIETLSIKDLSVSFNLQIVSLSANTELNKTFDPVITKILDLAKTSTVLICVDDYSNADPYIKRICKMISQWFQDKYPNIYLLLTTDSENVKSEFDYTQDSVRYISLSAYNKDDIIEYLKQGHMNSIVSNNDKHIDSILKISKGNLSIAEFLFVDFVVGKGDQFESLEKVVDDRLLKIMKSGKEKDLSELAMEDIILSSSLTLQKRFSPNHIAFVTERENNLVASGLDIAKDNNIIEKDLQSYYLFNCSEVKEVLYRKSINKRSDRLLSYYKFYTENEPDEYYYRAFYLTVYFREITPQSFALLTLSYIYSIKLGDINYLAKIEKLFDYDKSDFIAIFKTIKVFLNSIYSEDSPVESINSLFKTIESYDLEQPLLAEINRSYFYYLYRQTESFNNITESILEKCIVFAQDSLKLSHFDNPIGLKPVDEVIIRCNIIFTIAPYILDVKNDTDQFKALYRISQDISQNGLGTRNRGIAQYIENVFNRKAFLYVNPAQCDVYYKKAENYFKRNNIWVEYCVTLICHAGTDIVVQKYDESLELCENAIQIANEKDFSIPQIAKLYNNKLIAEFLKTEKEAKNRKKCLSQARKTVLSLQKQLNNKPCATEYVILTNICSLSLYCEDDKKYNKYKIKLEKMLKCPDVSDVSNKAIDDFYRYYFAWFESYRAIRDHDWERAKKISISLENFVPALFQNQENFFNRKYQALISIIEHQVSISASDFCLKLVNTDRRETIISDFYLRGLMLSDLQYTSYF